MWSITDKCQLERCDQIQIKLNSNSTRKMWSNTDKGQLEGCAQLQIQVN